MPHHGADHFNGLAIVRGPEKSSIYATLSSTARRDGNKTMYLLRE
jgi:hypothetical protein